MERQTALLIVIIFFIFVVLTARYGIDIRWFSAFALATILSLILLNIFYPPSQMTQEDADFTLVIYAFLEIFGFFFLLVYVLCKSIVDTIK